MTSRLQALCFDANDPQRIARFWAALLGWQQDEALLIPTDDTGFQLRFLLTDQLKTVQNQAHFDLTSSSVADQRATVGRALELGAQHIDVGQQPQDRHVVLADPEGNEFCVIEPGNSFLAECGFVGALACDGSQAVGYFWSHALGWPLVWDQDQETAIRSPQGGPKITWGGPPFKAKMARNRLHFELVPVDDQHAELARLISLGASRLGLADDGRMLMTDPDGNEFCLLPTP